MMACTPAMASQFKALDSLPTDVWPVGAATPPSLSRQPSPTYFPNPYLTFTDPPSTSATPPLPSAATTSHEPPIPLARRPPPEQPHKAGPAPYGHPNDRLWRRGSISSTTTTTAASPVASASSLSPASSCEPREVIIPVIATKPASLKRKIDHVEPRRPAPADRSLMDAKSPRVWIQLWEDEETFCFQVCRSGHIISRRVDNDYVNCTKLINLAGFTRGKRDLILKREKTKHIVRVGNMQLKGVWLPLAAARAIATTYSLLSQLSPLFDDDIGEQIFAPDSITRTACLVDATRTELRQRELSAQSRKAQGAPERKVDQEKHDAMLAYLDGVEERVKDVERPLFACQSYPPAIPAPRPTVARIQRMPAPKKVPTCAAAKFRAKLPPSPPPEERSESEEPLHPSPRSQREASLEPALEPVATAPSQPTATVAPTRVASPVDESDAFSFGVSYAAEDRRPAPRDPIPHHRDDFADLPPPPPPPAPLLGDRRHSYPSTSYQAHLGYDHPSLPPRRYSTLPQWPHAPVEDARWPNHALEHSIPEYHSTSSHPSYSENQYLSSSYTYSPEYYPGEGTDVHSPHSSSLGSSAYSSSQPATPGQTYYDAPVPSEHPPFSPLYPVKAYDAYHAESYPASYTALWSTESTGAQVWSRDDRAYAEAICAPATPGAPRFPCAGCIRAGDRCSIALSAGGVAIARPTRTQNPRQESTRGIGPSSLAWRLGVDQLSCALSFHLVHAYIEASKPLKSYVGPPSPLERMFGGVGGRITELTLVEEIKVQKSLVHGARISTHSVDGESKPDYDRLKSLLADPILIYLDEVARRVNGASQNETCIKDFQECLDILDDVQNCITGFLGPVTQAADLTRPDLNSLVRVPDLISWTLMFAASVPEYYHAIHRILGEIGSRRNWNEATPVEMAWGKLERALLEIIPAIDIRMAR
ncbi:hypothetical protein RQP46_001900 [Phenoliferia psychrophenolica]